MIKLISFLIIMLFPCQSFAIKDVEFWEDVYLKRWDRQYEICNPRSTSEDSWDIYLLAPCIDANNSMFMATGRTKYLDRSLHYIENKINAAKLSSTYPRSQFKDDETEYLSWVNHTHRILQDDGKEYSLFESYGWRYVTQLLRLMRESPNIYNDKKYQKKYSEIFAFTERHIFKKWWTRGTSNIYRSRTHMASHWAYIALELSILTNNEKDRLVYKEIYDNINKDGLPNYKSSLRSQLVFNESNNTYFWSSVWNDFSHPGQDIDHGTNVISFIVEAYNLGIGWTKTDMIRFKNTFSKIIWPENDEFRKYVDGSGVGRDWEHDDGFCKLGRFDPSLQERLESRAKSSGTQFTGACALNARLLLSEKPTSSWSKIYSLQAPVNFLLLAPDTD